MSTLFNTITSYLENHNESSGWQNIPMIVLYIDGHVNDGIYSIPAELKGLPRNSKVEVSVWQLKILSGDLLLKVSKYALLKDPILQIPLVLCPLTDSPEIQRLIKCVRY